MDVALCSFCLPPGLCALGFALALAHVPGLVEALAPGNLEGISPAGIPLPSALPGCSHPSRSGGAPGIHSLQGQFGSGSHPSCTCREELPGYTHPHHRNRAKGRQSKSYPYQGKRQKGLIKVIYNKKGALKKAPFVFAVYGSILFRRAGCPARLICFPLLYGYRFRIA